MQSCIASDILNVDQTRLQFQYLLECLYRSFSRSVMQHVAPISISCSTIDLQLLTSSCSQQILYNMRMVVDSCQVKDMIVLIGQFVYCDSLDLSLLPDLEDFSEDLLHAFLAGVMQDCPSICILFVDICTAEDQQTNGLETVLCLEGFDSLKKRKGAEYGLLFVDFLATGEQEVHLPRICQLGSLTEIEDMTTG